MSTVKALRSRSLLRMIAIPLLFIGVAVVLTWPLARLLPIAVAYPGDPLINTWVLAWGVHALTHAPSTLFDANIFFPAQDALAFSENLFGLLPLALPLSLTFGPLTVHNILLILGFAFSGYGAYVLGRTLTGSTAAGLAAGMVYGFVPWRFTHITHLQHAWGGWLPLILAALVHFHRRRDRRSAGFLAVALLMNGLTNLHYLVFGFAAVAVIGMVAIISSPQMRNVRSASLLLLAVAMPALILVTVLWPYRSVQERHGIRGNAAETDRYTASPRDWTTPDSEGEPERRVFPGYVGIVAGIAGLSAARRRPDRPYVAAAALLLVAAVVLSLGRATPPYAFAFDHLAVISGIRAPARWAVLGYCALAALAALGTGRRTVLASVVCVAAVIQVWQGPIRWYLMPEDVAPVYRWLARNEQPGGILELPIGERDFYYLQGAATHHQPIFNGASGAAPATYLELGQTFGASGISTAALQRLRELGGSTIVVHSDALGGNREEIKRWLRDALADGSLGYLGYFEAGLSGDFVFGIGRRGKPTDSALTTFLAGEAIPWHSSPFGFLETPGVGTKADGPLQVRGWALSPTGIRAVRLWLANKACHVDATLEPYPSLQRVVPQYSTEKARFVATIPERPCGGMSNDVLVELIDFSGRTTTLPHVWFEWQRDE